MAACQTLVPFAKIPKFANGRTNERTNGRTDGRTDGRTNGRTDGQTDGGTDGRTFPTCMKRNVGELEICESSKFQPCTTLGAQKTPKNQNRENR